MCIIRKSRRFVSARKITRLLIFSSERLSLENNVNHCNGPDLNIPPRIFFFRTTRHCYYVYNDHMM